MEIKYFVACKGFISNLIGFNNLEMSIYTKYALLMIKKRVQFFMLRAGVDMVSGSRLIRNTFTNSREKNVILHTICAMCNNCFPKSTNIVC